MVSKALLLEGEGNQQRMLAAVPLTDDERAAVGDGQTALGQLLGQFAGVPTSAGPTLPANQHTGQVALLPVIEINRRPT
ncbi:hypothetical protein ACIBF7_44305 [Nonomuraea sp. NPDC050478]|uniref:hypothetical protein n=1 Tax=Nonomuraea sp. NPDC050478 TaxID=3364365 RepID=UPI0037B55ACE